MLWKLCLVNIITLFCSGAIAGECDQLPMEFNMNLELCCSFPNVSDPDAELKIQNLVKNMPPNPKASDQYTMACKIAHTVFTEMKLVKDNLVNKDAYAKMVDSKVKDEWWKQPLKEAFDQCEPIVADVAKIQNAFAIEPFSIKKEDCNAQFLAMFICIHLDSFVKCPEKAWKSNEKDPNQKTCSAAKTWFGKCGKDLDALKKMIEKGH